MNFRNILATVLLVGLTASSCLATCGSCGSCDKKSSKMCPKKGPEEKKKYRGERRKKREDGRKDKKEGNENVLTPDQSEPGE